MKFCKNSNNEEYTENKHSEGNNVQKDKEADEMEECALQGEDDGRKTRICHCFTYNQSDFFK
jgi:hypothetical protein